MNRNLNVNDGPHVRRVGLEGSTAESQVRAVIRDLPDAVAGLEELVGGRGRVNQVRDPGVPVMVLTSVVALCTHRYALSNSAYQPGSTWQGMYSCSL